jgi:hypothetical protein
LTFCNQRSSPQEFPPYGQFCPYGGNSWGKLIIFCLKNLNFQNYLMSSTTNDTSISKLLKKINKITYDNSITQALLVSIEGRLKNLEDVKAEDNNQDKSNNKSSSYLPPFILEGPKGYKDYLINEFRMELEERFSHLPFIQSLR